MAHNAAASACAKAQEWRQARLVVSTASFGTRFHEIEPFGRRFHDFCIFLTYNSPFS